MGITTYQFNYVLQGIKRQIPIYKSLDSLNIYRGLFYTSLTAMQRRILDEYCLLYNVYSSATVYISLKRRGIYFETLDTDLFDGEFKSANSQYVELLSQCSNSLHY